MRKLQTVLAIVCVAWLVAASSHFQQAQPMTPKQKAILFMHTYNAQCEDYLILAAKPDLTEEQKQILREKKAILMKLYPLVNAYINFVEKGDIPSEEIENEINSLLNGLGGS